MTEEAKNNRINQIYAEAKTATPKELRRLHKELKKLDPGRGFPVYVRYPDFPMQISIASGVVSGILLLSVILALLLR